MNATDFENACCNTAMPMQVRAHNVLPNGDAVVLTRSSFYLSGDFTPEQKSRAIAAVKEAIANEGIGWKATVHVRVPGHGGYNGKRCQYSAQNIEPDAAAENAVAHAIRALESDVVRWEKLVKNANRAIKKLHKQRTAIKSVRAGATKLLDVPEVTP